MFLFIIIAVLCLLLTVAGDLVKLVQFSKLLHCVSNTGLSDELQQQLQDARAKLQRVRESSATTSHYTQTIKTMRAENELKTLEAKMRNENNMQRLKGASVELVVGYVLKGIISLALFIITIRNRHLPVMIFDESINLQPLGAILSFPTGVHNAISVPVWALACNSTFRVIYNALKGK